MSISGPLMTMNSLEYLKLSIPGLLCVPNFISETEHDLLMSTVDTMPWSTELKRRIQHYGYRYDYKMRSVDSSMYLGELPYWVSSLAQRLWGGGWFEAIPDQAIVNEYWPGQGITRHIDCIPCFGPTVAIVSMGSACVMEFSQGREKRPIKLEPCSLLLLQDEARYKWQHCIPARKKDRYDDTTIKRNRRVSITFRTIVNARRSR